MSLRARQSVYNTGIIHQPESPLAALLGDAQNAPSPSPVPADGTPRSTSGDASRAFSLVPDARFCYLTTRHQHGLRRIVWALNGSSLASISGRSGTGKSTLLLRVRQELESLGGYQTTLVRVPVRCTASGFSLAIVAATGLAPARNTYDHLRQISSLAASVYVSGRRLVLLVDDADRLTQRMCGVLHALAVVTVGHDLAIGIVLAGGPRLEKRLRGYPALQSRVGARLNLSPLSPEETREMILFRCRAADVPAPPPLDANLQRLHRLSHGNSARVVAACLAADW